MRQVGLQVAEAERLRLGHLGRVRVGWRVRVEVRVRHGVRIRVGGGVRAGVRVRARLGLGLG